MTATVEFYPSNKDTMLNFPIIDTHVHFWDPNHLRYSWLDDNGLLNQTYGLEAFNELTNPVEVEQIVFVEAGADTGQALAESEWVSSLAKIDPRITGIVAHAPLENGEDVRPYLKQLGANPLIKGVRRLLQGEEDNAFCLRPGFVDGVQALPDYGLSFDICIYHHQMANVIKLVEQCPDVQFILDHIGKPDIKAQLFSPWRTEIKQLAQFPNVWCKISGLVTEADHAQWTPEDLHPYIGHVIKSFGYDRVMFGGDWPVARLAAEYPRWVEVLDSAIVGCSDAEKQKLFHDNAIACYRL